MSTDQLLCIEADKLYENIAGEMEYFKQKLLAYPHLNDDNNKEYTHNSSDNNQNFQQHVNTETELLLSRFKFEVEKFKQTLASVNTNSNNAALQKLQKAQYIIRMQNMSMMIVSQLQNPNCSS